ncbi:WhiB family transcriptional regulator [Streptomyces phaeochromogenes]|uniref:WhiB family transcriptional regulator n=1 Tax=Streptomyces phaeochromogenes TaxID=1923 RepID=UPI002253B754|nr:WhiB family transcriptional regulator [Streptomyces phaeochromogenes]MCX5601570.1 WhiB family transcriptional regulator [Streptomyces phaeochromogenes]
MPDREWMLDARCRGTDDVVDFFTDNQKVAASITGFCGPCPVRVECLDYQLAYEETHPRHGIFGGLTATERRDLAVRRPQAAAEAAS